MSSTGQTLAYFDWCAEQNQPSTAPGFDYYVYLECNYQCKFGYYIETADKTNTLDIAPRFSDKNWAVSPQAITKSLGTGSY